MRVLLLNQYYPPDRAPTGRMLHDVACTLAERGHRVDVLCSRRSYDDGTRFPLVEERDGVRIRRLRASGFGRGAAWRRFLDSASFAMLLVPRLLRTPRPDLVVALTTPPFLGAIAAAACRVRGLRLAHWLMDLYPDVLAAQGWLRPRGVVYKTLAALARWQAKRAALVLALGPRMAERVALGTGAPPEWVPLWSEATLVERGWPAERLVLLWTGNLGRGHRLADFLAAADRLGASGPLWVFAGRGPRRQEVMRFASTHPRVCILDSIDSVGRGDVVLASIAPGWEGVIVPHKAQGAFAAGRPLILAAHDASESAAWVRESGGGWVVAPGDVDGLLAAIEEAHDPSERVRRGAAALAYARERFDPARNRARVADLLETAAVRRSSA